MTPIKVSTIAFIAIQFSDDELIYIRQDGRVLFPPTTGGVAYNRRTLDFLLRLSDEIGAHNRWAEKTPAIEP